MDMDMRQKLKTNSVKVLPYKLFHKIYFKQK